MKIQSVKNNSFKGLLISRSKENNNRWSMEYRPYSWELSKFNVMPIMAEKKPIDLTKVSLPDNETSLVKSSYLYEEFTEDIFKTKSYYKNRNYINNGEFHSEISIGEPLNREDSLNIYLKKMLKFQCMKCNELSKLAEFTDESLTKSYSEYQKAFKKYDDAFILKNMERKMMEKSVSNLYEEAKKIYENAKQYIKISSTLLQSHGIIRSIQEELDLIKAKKADKDVIDISVRSGVDPNAPLKEFLKNKKVEDLENSETLLILPATSILIKKLVSDWHDGKIHNKNLVNSILNNVKARIHYAIK